MWFSTSSLAQIDIKPSITPFNVRCVKSVLSRSEKKVACKCVIAFHYLTSFV